MHPTSPLAPFLQPLESLGLPYCITGSVAASVYGEPRLTADIDVVLLLRMSDIAARDPLHAWALAQRRRISLDEGGAWIAPPEYVILRKLEYLREGTQDKHVRDIRFMLAASDIDRAFVDAEVARLGLQAQWRQCQPEVGHAGLDRSAPL